MNTQKISLDYQYYTINEIFQKVNILGNFQIIDYIILFVCIVFSILIVLYIGPFIRFIYDNKLIDIQKKKKKKNLRKILIQKEIEAEIEKEVNN